MSQAIVKEADADWKTLFEFQKEYRKTHNVSATFLVNYFNLPNTLIRYLYSDKMIPSRKINTLGYKLRQALHNLKEENPAIIMDITQGFCDKLYDFQIKHSETLKDLGVITIFGHEDESENHNGISAKLIVDRDVDLDAIVEKFSELDFDLIDPIKNSIHLEKWKYMGFFGTPTCIIKPGDNGAAVYGTGNILLMNLGLVGVTAKHVLENIKTEDSKIIFAYESSQITSGSQRHNKSDKYTELAHASTDDFHEQLDVAVFHPFHEHSYLVNRMLNPPYDFIIADHTINNYALTGKRIMKNGCSTRLTYGVISAVTPDYFIVTSTEVGWFCTPGDSGSLIVVCEESNSPNNIAVGILSQCNPSDGSALCVFIMSVCDIPSIKDDDDQTAF